jgi:hypothetical protein
MNTFQILSSKFRFDLMHWNVSIGREKWPIFGCFLTLFPLKRPARREKIPPNMAATISDIMDDIHVQVLYTTVPAISLLVLLLGIFRRAPRALVPFYFPGCALPYFLLVVYDASSIREPPKVS